MNKVIYLFCLSYFLLSCEKKEDVINKTIKSTINTKEEKNPKSDLKPLFLGLSPNMSDEEFQRKIKQLNGKGILENSNFDISIGNDVISFSVSKTKNTIRLETSDSILNVYSTEDHSTKGSNDATEEFIEKKNKILKIYIDKYNKSKVQIPHGINLAAYKLSQEKYILLEDQDKYVLFGYSLIDGGSPVEENLKPGNGKDTTQEGDSFGFGLNSIKPNSEFQSKTISLEIQIDYINPDEMNTLLDRMMAEKQHKIDEQKKMKLEKSKKDLQKADNIQKI